jgi:hypothetical protein
MSKLKELHNTYGRFATYFYIIYTADITEYESDSFLGPVVRLGPSDVSFATTSAYDTLYGIGADQHFGISGSRRSLLVDAGLMTDVMLPSCLGSEPRSWLRPLVASTLSSLTGENSERMFNTAFEQGLKSHHVGHDPSAPIDLTTLHQDYVWILASFLAFGRQPKLFSKCMSMIFPSPVPGSYMRID